VNLFTVRIVLLFVEEAVTFVRAVPLAVGSLTKLTLYVILGPVFRG
jgi:hypothetical protein